MKSVDVQLQKAHLMSIEHASLQEKVRAEGKRKVSSRRSIYKADHLPRSTSFGSKRRPGMRRKPLRSSRRRREAIPSNKSGEEGLEYAKDIGQKGREG